jgi:hypothetical protein
MKSKKVKNIVTSLTEEGKIRGRINKFLQILYLICSITPCIFTELLVLGDDTISTVREKLSSLDGTSLVFTAQFFQSVILNHMP